MLPNSPYGPGIRLNFSHYIPELGILLVGSTESARVGLLSLTRLNHRTESGETKIAYGFRQELLLPLSEEVSYKYEGSLVGIAAGPVQGQLDSDGQEQYGDATVWRILLYYALHAVYTYEIRVSRPPRDTSLLNLSL